jgi:ankyrin repeat protein
MLLGNGVDAKQAVMGKDDCGSIYQVTPLQLAATHGHVAIVELLLEQGVDVDKMGHYVASPLHEAARGGHATIVRLLLNQGASVNSTHRFEGSPLGKAVCNQHESVVRMLLDNGASVNTRDYWNTKQPLYLAAKTGNKAIVQYGEPGIVLKDTVKGALQAATDASYKEVAQLLEEYSETLIDVPPAKKLKRS